MKITLSILALLISGQLYSQNILTESKRLDELKKKNYLTSKEHINNSHPSSLHISQNGNQVTTTSCDCWLERDSTWSVVALMGGNGTEVPPYYRCDDASSDTIHLPFDFCFYSNLVNYLFINSNGNITLIAPLSVFTSDPFPNTTNSMIAPFWSDVDTRDTASGLVYYKLTSHYLAVQWDGVGYYQMHSDLLNHYQVIISDGTDSLLNGSNNVGFCYKDMQWTTGDASGGTFGFGGTPATVGVNQGNGIDYIAIGLYDHSGIDYDGPGGNNDGVNSLDNQSFVFNTCTSNSNIPPIAISTELCDTIQVCVNDTFVGAVHFLSPETGQNTIVTLDSNGIGGTTVISSVTGTQAGILYHYIPDQNNVGIVRLFIVAIDDGGDTTTLPVTFNVSDCSPLGISNTDTKNISIFPNPVHDILRIRNIPRENSLISIKNIFGQTVLENHFKTNPDIDLSPFSNGIYFIKIQNEYGTIELKIIKN